MNEILVVTAAVMAVGAGVAAVLCFRERRAASDAAQRSLAVRAMVDKGWSPEDVARMLAIYDGRPPAEEPTWKMTGPAAAFAPTPKPPAKAK